MYYLSAEQLKKLENLTIELFKILNVCFEQKHHDKVLNELLNNFKNNEGD